MKGPVRACPAALAAWLSSPASSRHLGQSPCAASADSSAPHFGHRGLSVIRGLVGLLSPSSKENAAPGYSFFFGFPANFNRALPGAGESRRPLLAGRPPFRRSLPAGSHDTAGAS